jgi:hypothetical protein
MAIWLISTYEISASIHRLSSISARYKVYLAQPYTVKFDLLAR